MTAPLRHRVKWLVVHALHALGVLQLWKVLALRHRAVVLMYHRVLPRDAFAGTWSHRGIIVTPDTFERQMQFLRKHFRVLSPAEFTARVESGLGFENASCLVTFDDGWIDTYTQALPVMRRYGIPALVFLPSAYIGTGAMFWQEQLGAILHGIWRRARSDGDFAAAARVRLEPFGLTAVLDLPEKAVREGIIEVVRRRKTAANEDPFEPIRALSALAGPGNGSASDVDRFMDWDQVRAMHDAGFAFGAHGDTHRQLTTLTQAEVRRELDTSRRALEAAIGEPPTTVSYPNGDLNQVVVEEAQRVKFSVGFSTEPGRVDAGANPLAVRRINIHEDTTRSLPLFLARLVGVV